MSNKDLEKMVQTMSAKLEEYERQLAELNLDSAYRLKTQEVEPQTKLSQKQKENVLTLKPSMSLMAVGQKFNEDFRKEYEERKKYTKFIAEHRECPGDTIEFWTRPYGGLPAEFWKVPTNRVVEAPRYVAEELSDRSYVSYRMDGDDTSERNRVGTDGFGVQYGQMVATHKTERVTAYPAQEKKTLFMGG